ncbi:MAG TPA: FGGY-family carbohydrate kinase [Anaerohalosphaeraceae bacterium]|jgi:L-xylulokinase|nr:FGGY-family carbohydrate kinase [Anaerohalosphaeraceae bacterium]HRT50280.1 FGGY-family carbohydrate kinase [Anaerohalosphaeraceae bacterium]HRT86199.1 FGGY-family carbohydrate kinase [Anaerohalosphaeraceae bacterium]
MAKYLLGIDNGATVSKAALFSLDGAELAAAAEKTEMLTPRPDWVERDMEAMWTATAGAISKVLAQAGIDPADIACVACTGHGNGLYLVDADGRPVRNAIISTDSRARAYVERWLADGIDKKVRPTTMQSPWAAQPNALLAWLRDNEPHVLRRAAWVLMAKDYTRFRLTGRINAELTDFTGTSLLNLRTRDYDDDLLAAFGIADMRRMLPPIIGSADIAGEVTAAAAAQTGLAKGTPVAGGMFDIDACALASGLVDESRLCMIAGTWGNNQYVSRTPVVDEDVFMTSCYAIPGYYLMLEGSATSAANLEWFVTHFFDADRRLAEQQGQSVFDIVNAAVATTRPDESHIVFLPFLFGSNANHAASASLIGIKAWHNRGHVLRAIFEGVVFGHKAHVERLLRFRPMPAAVRLTGGAARSRQWVQVFADILQVPVEIPEGTELGALGAAIAAAVASGCSKNYNEAIENMVHISRRQEPDAAMKNVYDAKYENCKASIRALDPIWKNLA